jgi:alkanesulfonate monooxygenase SsuD/methylene tetrahydromethanopterin reductase-like flavin-dependent oxidoreductase (luciferase family)
MRFGLTILPEHRWADSAPMWRRAEELGFDHAWTYDHLVWGGLPDSPWFGTVPTLTAAALVTSTIRLGTFVTSPNYRHPVTFMRDLLALDDISAGRFTCGIGAGGDIDSTILGGQQLTPRQRFDRLAEFTGLLDRLLTQDHVSHRGTYFSAIDARTLPGPVQRPRIPFLMAANGPRSLGLAVEHGAGWVTTGPEAETLDEWWAALSKLTGRLDVALAEAGRDPAGFERHLSLDTSPRLALSSIGAFEEMVARAADLGFTDVITHWPRADGPYAGDVRVLEAVASQVIPAFR